MASVGKNIKYRRKKLNMSQEDLASRIFTTRQTISNYENGKSNPDIDTLKTLAEALDTDVMFLLYGEDNPKEKVLKDKIKKLSIGIGILAVIVIVLYKLLELSEIIGLYLWDQVNAKIIVNTDIDKYRDYIGETAGEEYRNKFDMDESIFPQFISDNMQVEDYKMVYYNPWDAQYLSCLVVQYDPESYRNEIKRLQSIPMEEYIGLYGAEGFDEKYDLLAMNADQTYGFIYALSDKTEENGSTNENVGINENRRIIYVEILFCNYFMDLEYENYIDTEFLPIGFDASEDNEYRQHMLDL